MLHHPEKQQKKLNMSVLILTGLNMASKKYSCMCRNIYGIQLLHKHLIPIFKGMQLKNWKTTLIKAKRQREIIQAEEGHKLTWPEGHSDYWSSYQHRKDDLCLQQTVHSMCALLLATVRNHRYKQNKWEIAQKQGKEHRNEARGKTTKVFSKERG